MKQQSSDEESGRDVDKNEIWGLEIYLMKRKEGREVRRKERKEIERGKKKV